MLLAVCAPILLAWSWAPTARDLRSVGSRGNDAGYYQPLDAYLARHDPRPFRLEIRSRAVTGRARSWPAVHARPWVGAPARPPRQPDLLPGRRPSPRPGAYHAWLRAQAVRYVALPDAALDYSAIGRPP